MVKLLAVCALLCAIFFTESRAEYHVVDHQLENSYTLTTNVNLYTIWLTNTSLHLNSTDKNLKPCNIPIDPSKDFTTNQIQAKALPSGQKFVVWGIRNYVELAEEESEVVEFKEYTVLLVDPWRCNYKSVQLPSYNSDTFDRNIPYSYGDPLVITNADSFDVFLPGLQNYSPCRFDVEGKKIKLEHQLEFLDLKLMPYVSPKRLHLQPLHPLNRKLGYFFAHNFENDTAVMRHIDEHFKTLKELYFDHPVHSVSIWPAKEPIISICYTSQNSQSVNVSTHLKVHCTQLDSKLEHKYTFRLPVPENNFVSGMLHLTHQIDPLGNIYVGLIETSNKRTQGTDSVETRQFRYFVYDKAGKLLESHDFHKVDTVLRKEAYARYDHGLHSLILIGDKFCVMSEDNYNVIDNTNETYETIRCFDIGQYYKS